MSNLIGNWSDAFDIVPEPVILVTGGGEIVAANEAGRALLPGLAEGRRLADWLESGEAQFDAVAAKLKRTTGTLPFALTLKTPDGTPSRLRMTGRRLREDAGGLHFVLRAPPGAAEKGPLKIFSATPVFLVPITKRDVLVLRRLDRSAPEVAIPITARSVDLADAGPALRLGGHYEAQVGDRIVEFLVDPRARYRGGPLIGRLVPL